MRLAIVLREHLIHVPAPLGEAHHPADPLPLDISCKKRPEPVPPKPHGFVAYVYATLEQQILNIP